jgi:hypothetical protein
VLGERTCRLGERTCVLGERKLDAMTSSGGEPGPVRNRAVPRAVVVGGVVAAGAVSWIGAGLVAWNAWRAGFVNGHSRVEAASTVYLVLALLSTALVALPFTFLQWVDPEQKQRWRTAGGAVGLVGCGIFLLLWVTG